MSLLKWSEMARFIVFFITAFLFASFTWGQSPAEFNSKLLKELDERDYGTAISRLEENRKSDPKAFESNNYDYLLGRLAEKTGDTATAMRCFQGVIARGSVLKEYALFHAAQIVRSTGNLALERVYLKQLIDFSPDSLLAAAAYKGLVKNAYAAGNYSEAIRMLSGPPPAFTAASSKTAETAQARENTLLLGRAYMQSGQAAAARDAFNSLLNKMPNQGQPDDFALEATGALDVLDGGVPGKKAPKLAEMESQRRGFIYQFNRDFLDARLHNEALIENYPSGNGVPDAMYQIGRGYALQYEYNEAIKWFERVQSEFPESPSAKDALSQAASAYSKLGKSKEAITRYQKFIDKYPDDERLDRAYLNIVDVLRDQGDDTEALKWTQKTQDVFKGKLPEAIALFTEARIYLSKGDWQNCLAKLDAVKKQPDLGGTRVPAGTSQAEVNFLRAFCLEQLRRFPEAIDAYLAVPDGRNEYYGWRSNERLKELNKNDAAKSVIAQKIAALNTAAAKDPDARRKNLQDLLRLTDSAETREKSLDELGKIYKSLPAYQKIPSFKLIEINKSESDSAGANVHKIIAGKLFLLGLYDEGAVELDAATQNETKSPDFAYTLARTYLRGDRGDKAVTFMEPLWKPVPADYQIELIPREQLQMLYPAPYVEHFLKYAPGKGIDPRYMLSIIRQESRYKPDIKSYAAARGMLQFISTTSNTVAAKLGRDNFRQDELYIPSTAILFGSQYLADLFAAFPNQPDAVAASYNGGDDNMKRWLDRAKSSQPERYVPEIVFSQSKDYVQKVMANYRIYQSLYDERLNIRKSD